MPLHLQWDFSLDPFVIVVGHGRYHLCVQRALPADYAACAKVKLLHEMLGGETARYVSSKEESHLFHLKFYCLDVLEGMKRLASISSLMEM